MLSLEDKVATSKSFWWVKTSIDNEGEETEFWIRGSGEGYYKSSGGVYVRVCRCVCVCACICVYAYTCKCLDTGYKLQVYVY